ncbi:MAG: hypothetical protein ACHQAX_00885 [Gammaproteobacteria bacterium]
MVMLLLVILAMGMLSLSNHQVQAIRVNQWHDTAIRMDHAVDMALLRFMESPAQLPQAMAPMGNINQWPNEPLSSWQMYPGAYHEMTEWGGEVHIITEGLPNKQTIYRLNALGYHPLGGVLKKQCVISCEETMCRRLSCIISEGGTDGRNSEYTD